MKDVLVGLIVIWVLYKLFGGQTIIHRYTFNQNNMHPPERPREGEVKVEKNTKKNSRLKDEAGEYVDYEEIK
jgi:hypothetical protein